MLNDKSYKYKVYNSDRDELIDAIYEHFKDRPNNIVTKEIILSLIVDYEGLIMKFLVGLSTVEHVLTIPGIGYIYNDTLRKKRNSLVKNMTRKKNNPVKQIMFDNPYSGGILEVKNRVILKRKNFKAFMHQELNYFFLVG